ncbi:MAG: hypothetical protein COA79_20080 [Planctomycetota bacterium]|nr:MAG: hypothetical protein COA79_20080 [Planctomycetota bacterium]
MIFPVITFILMTFIIGIHSASRIGGKVKNFFVAGNIIPFWVLALSLSGQAIEVGSTTLNANISMTNPFLIGAIYPIGIGISLVLIGLFFAKPLHKMRLLTLPDFYFRRYDKSVETIVSFLCVASFIVLLAANLAGLGFILSQILPGTLTQSQYTIMIALIIMIYTMAGGLFAVTWNDILHVGVILLGFVAAFIWMVNNKGSEFSMSTISTQLTMDPLIDFNKGALQNWAYLLALGLGDIIAIDFMERVFAAKSPRYAKASCILSGLLTIMIGTLIAFIGILAFTFFPEGTKPENLNLISFINQYLPHGIGMMVMIGLIGACISTADGAIMACSVVISKNVIQQRFPNLIPQNRLLLFSRLTAIPITILSIVVAIYKPEPGTLLVLAFDMVFAGCLIPLTLGIYWKKANARAAFWAMLIPSTVRLAFFFIEEYKLIGPNLFGLGTIVSPILSLTIFIAFCYGRKEDEKALKL